MLCSSPSGVKVTMPGPGASRRNQGKSIFQVGNLQVLTPFRQLRLEFKTHTLKNDITLFCAKYKI